MQPRSPSGLFPSSGPTRPTFREPHPIRVGPVFAGVGAAVAWLLLIGLIGDSLPGYVWLTIVASLAALLAAAVLVRSGDRGVAVGVAAATGVGLAVAVVATVLRWAATGWPLW